MTVRDRRRVEAGLERKGFKRDERQRHRRRFVY